MNPRVVLWAHLNDVDPTSLVRKSRDDDLFRINGTIWTVAYSQWVQGLFRDYYMQCHGTMGQGGCCCAVSTDGRFDAWLEEKYDDYGSIRRQMRELREARPQGGGVLQ